MGIDKLTLNAGVDIAVADFQVNIHQPTINEIAFIGEERFYSTLGVFNISTERVLQNLSLNPLNNDIEKTDLVKKSIESLSDFELLLQVLKEEPELSADFISILTLLLPQYIFSIEDRMIFCSDKSRMFIITEENFPILRTIIKTMFCLDAATKEEFNPSDDRARAIAEKIKKSRERVRASKGESKEKNYILANYISSLGIGSNALNILDAVKLTVYQLFNQMERYGLYVQSDYAMKAAMAGAKNVEQIDWLKNL